MMYRLALAGIALLAGLSAPFINEQDNHTGFPFVLPVDVETRMARAAAPDRISEEAGILLLGKEGYYESQPSRNGFWCLVERDPNPAARQTPPDRQVFAPQCYDSEGRTSYILRLVERSQWFRKDGLDAAQVQRRENEEGDRYAPTRPGISYMTSALNTVANPSDRQGPFVTYVPHVMFYGPGLTDKDISNGVATSIDGFLSGWPFLPGPARPNGLIIMPLDRELQKSILAEQRDLIDILRSYVPINRVEMND